MKRRSASFELPSGTIITVPDFTEEERQAQRVWARVACMTFQCLLTHNQRSLKRTHLREDDERTAYETLEDLVREASELGVI